MLSFKNMEVSKTDNFSGILEHKKVEFSDSCFYCAINIVHVDDGREWPWLVVLQNKKEKSPFLGLTYSTYTEEEAISKAEELWKEVKNNFAYLAKN